MNEFKVMPRKKMLIGALRKCKADQFRYRRMGK